MIRCLDVMTIVINGRMMMDFYKWTSVRALETDFRGTIKRGSLST